jgi:hypothetical protein
MEEIQSMLVHNINLEGCQCSFDRVTMLLLNTVPGRIIQLGRKRRRWQEETGTA